MVTMGSPALRLTYGEGIVAIGKFYGGGHRYKFLDGENLPCHVKRSQPLPLSTLDGESE